MDNRQGLVVDVMLTPAGGTSERDAAYGDGARRRTNHGGRRPGVRYQGVRQAMPQPEGDASGGAEATLGNDGRTTRHEGYRVGQRVRKRVEDVFGWIKTVAGGRQLRYSGVDRNRM